MEEIEADFISPMEYEGIWDGMKGKFLWSGAEEYDYRFFGYCKRLSFSCRSSKRFSGSKEICFAKNNGLSIMKFRKLIYLFHVVPSLQ